MSFLKHVDRTRKQLGSGLITGAADDDPSGVATYSQAGAQFGGALLWTLVVTTPLMIGIQMVSARIGWVTGRGLAASIQRAMPRGVALALVVLLVLANTLNIAADIAAMGEALQLVVGGPEHGHALVFGALCVALPVWLDYERMVSVLKWLTLALFSYVAVVLMVRIDWRGVGVDSIAYLRGGGSDYWMTVVGVLGTTISPYMFFWQAAQEAELRQRTDGLRSTAPATRSGHQDGQGGGHHDDAPPGTHEPAALRAHLSRIRLDTVAGMLLSNVIALCILLAAAAAFHQRGVTDIQTSRQAAEALVPVAGRFALDLFALGIIGTGMLAVPVLAGSAAYAVADVMGWRSGLDRRVPQARGFYAVLVCATVAGTLLDFTALDPIKALFWSAVANGVVAVPIMAVMMRLAGRREVLGAAALGPRQQLTGWLATAVMAAAVLAMAWEWAAR